MAVSLCIPPRQGELCASIRFELKTNSTVLEVTSRHRVTKVETDPEQKTVAIWIDITDPETSRPVDVRIDILPRDHDIASRTQLLGEVEFDGRAMAVFGTYLGVVADEN
ncbi:hypothetical protein R4P64_33175 [Rhodococcus sp. IEGM 1366]|uniref:hypothetical protein n=1 Tax=Rhodococcus sp. IEGM 1366 TaxID=3082223 RepID=UPI002955B78A|nr:hypothetical protein [Rhodococcus sp. IEGM 1366]MDV8071366.1 hypothetical protein [Rhodococcus sp. IEGM 1366]